MVLSYSARLIDALRAAGLKLTPQRLAVVEALQGDQSHPTALELHERLRARFPMMSVGTIYNTLDALTRIGGCRELQMGGSTRFDPNVDRHDHAVCERCGSIRDVARSPGGPEPGCELAGFQVEHVERIYRGICASCGGAS
jgi:Fe2+ or Zn2+ uptake regulation protein